MKILIDINHPAHVHLFKNFYTRMVNKGHSILFTTRRKEIAHVLLRNYKLPFKDLGKHYKTLRGKLWGIFKYNLKLCKVAFNYKPDLFLSMGSIYASHVSFILQKPNILLQDTENAKFQHKLSYPFADAILTPGCYKDDLGKVQKRYNGYHELAYLHPAEFIPDFEVVNTFLKVREDEPYVILRFVSWDANHDTGHQGLSVENKILAVEEFKKFAKIFITSEKVLPAELEQYEINIPPEKIHHVLAYCSLLFGESATMASECAVLGRPAIFIDDEGRGYTDEQEKKYGLVFNFKESPEDQHRAIEKGKDILTLLKNDKYYFKDKHEYLLNETINVSEYLEQFVLKFMQKRSKNHLMIIFILFYQNYVSFCL